MSSSAGTKVTKDPEAFRNPVEEGPGTIISDSLAAESLRQGGDFAEGKVGISGQPSRGTTTNNRDTSGATALDAAPDAEARQAQDEWSESAQLNAGRGLGKAAGVGPTYNTKGTSGPKGTGPEPGKEMFTTETRDGHRVTAAPSREPVFESELKPKGRNIQEGGFDDNAPNATFDSDIGDRNDPGRLAEYKFERRNEESGPDAGGAGPRQRGLDKENIYDVVGEDNA